MRDGPISPEACEGWGKGSADPEEEDLWTRPVSSCVLHGPSQSQGDEIHGPQEGQGEQEQQQPGGVLGQQAYAPTLDQFVSEHGDILAGEGRGLAREVELACVQPLVLGGEAGQVEDLDVAFAGGVGAGAVHVLRHPHVAEEHVLLGISGQAELVLHGQGGGVLVAAVQTKALVHQAGRQAGHLLSTGHLQDCQQEGNADGGVHGAQF